MLVLSRKCGETIRIGQDITVTCLRVCGQIVKIGIDAPSWVRILRSELCREDVSGKSAEDPRWSRVTPPCR